MGGDLRRPNYFRKRLHGEGKIQVGRIISDDTDEMFFESDDFYTSEIRSEDGGKVLFEFRIYDYALHARSILDVADLVIYQGFRYEREAGELKAAEIPRAHWWITARRVG